MSDWSTSSIPDLTGKVAVVTGATGGLGYETALGLARAGAHVVLAGRNAQKGARALLLVRTMAPHASVAYMPLDLSRLSAVSGFAEAFAQSHDRLDMLVNNAGVMAPPERQETADGFELQFGTNYLGHVALTAALLPQLSASRARVVSLSSIAARNGAIDFDDLQARKSYRPWVSYGQSKLACLMFALELQRRSDAAGWGLTSVAAHPGIARTDLIENGVGRGSFMARMKPVMGFLFQSAADGALPQLYAATAPEVVPGGYYGPDGFMELRGGPKAATPPRQALDHAVAARLFTVSEELIGRSFPSRQLAA